MNKLAFALLFLVTACNPPNPEGPDAGSTMCQAGFADCDHDGTCETDVTKPENCGGCGLKCIVGPNAEATCSLGQCGLTCHNGFADCDAKQSNGCESDLTSPGSCGACGNSCGGACVNGACETCDSALAIDSKDPLDAAKAMGICGDSVVSAKWVLADGAAPPSDAAAAHEFDLGHGILTNFGPNLASREGAQLLALSSGRARRPSDPDYDSVGGHDKQYTGVSAPGFPRPSPACPGVDTGLTTFDPEALELELKVPEWANGFAFDFDFYTFEWPNYVCSRYNDFFISLLDPKPMNQVDGDLSFDPMGNPISVNAAFVDVCGCAGGPPCTAGGKTFTCSKGPGELTGTGFDDMGQPHAATSWLTTTAPAVPGQTIKLRFAIYDSGDHVLDSTVLLDKFRWLPKCPVVGTTPIGKVGFGQRRVQTKPAGDPDDNACPPLQ